MDKTIPPWIDQQNNDRRANAAFNLGAELPAPGKSNDLWRSNLENQARFISECTNGLLAQLTRNRQLMSNQFKYMSTQIEHITAIMAHAACRTIAIATNARQECGERRVFRLPLPTERRFENQMDRRKCLEEHGDH